MNDRERRLFQQFVRQHSWAVPIIRKQVRGGERELVLAERFVGSQLYREMWASDELRAFVRVALAGIGKEHQKRRVR